MSKTYSTNTAKFIWPFSGSQLLPCFTIKLVDTVRRNQSGSLLGMSSFSLQNLCLYHMTPSKDTLMMLLVDSMLSFYLLLFLSYKTTLKIILIIHESKFINPDYMCFVYCEDFHIFP